MEQPFEGSQVRKEETYWRKVDKIIIHNKFINEARSWKGFDFALLKLSPEHGTIHPEKAVMPVCLPSTGFVAKSNDSLYMSGYGRRSIPHCLTDATGPEKYEVIESSIKMNSNANPTYSVISYPFTLIFIMQHITDLWS